MCCYLPYVEGSGKVLIYFHGNAEDIGFCYEMARLIRRELKVNVLIVEYPGYGLYEGEPSS